MAALQFLAEMVRTGQPASALAHRFESVPQMLRNVRYTAGTDPPGRSGGPGRDRRGRGEPERDGAGG